MLTIGTRPPIGVKLSCIELTAPQEVSVVVVSKSDGVGDPEADLLALHVAAGLSCAQRLIDAELGEGRVAGALGPIGRRVTPHRNRMPMAPNSAQPCRMLPTMRPNVMVSAAPMANSSTIVEELVSAFGFS